ncbi:ABC transporter ATP-binding protein [Aggregicoccus sp. 17bor-14]|uniref:ABC transporter ATP-binding protein n=1 Tax=Myxococcaceae TaxID=31 RepID=UPI00129D0B4B|nr:MULTISPECIES: ABC transporter ATP-binding protein [Myxococcaceae]MBF5043311.1 ABC transporter ATP-binding protein [Simulacricoccus sp. 17bor-14]MRI89070.1 ABC transporter ATP-binding protein [Aggregicoccus sp. 17bor-14]
MSDVTDAVTTHGLSKRYGAETALEGVELRVPEGAVYVLVGVNGAGKSTTLKVLMNLERPDAGHARVLGLDTALQGPQVRAQVGYVPEHHAQAYGWMTCSRLLQHAAAYYPAWEPAYAERLSEAFGLKLQRKVSALSKGETRRLQLVLALAHRPRVLLLDEPTDGLDPVVRKRTLALLAEHLADTPTTVLVSTHHLHEVESLADHMGVLRDGRLVVQQSRDELQRTVRRYRVEVPERWELPEGLQAGGLRRSSAGRELQCTLVGEERALTERLASAGARVREVTPLSLEDAALAFFPEETSR